MAVPTTSAPDLVRFDAILIGANSIEPKEQYEAATEFCFIRSVFVPAVSMIFDAVQLYKTDQHRHNFTARILKSNLQQIKLLSSIPVNQLVSIYAAVSASSYNNRVSFKYTYISFEPIAQK